MNTTMMTMLIKDHQHTLEQEVQKSRGMRRVDSPQARLGGHFLAQLGCLLVSAGLRLQERYGTVGYTR